MPIKFSYYTTNSLRVQVCSLGVSGHIPGLSNDAHASQLLVVVLPAGLEPATYWFLPL